MSTGERGRSKVELKRFDATLRLIVYGFILVPLSAALALSFAFTPEDVEAGRVVLSPECLMKQLLGHGCPTCGLTRAFMALSHGRLSDAAAYNLASPVVYGMWWLATGVVVVALWRAAGDRRRWSPKGAR